MFDLIPNLMASILTILFPVFASYKALSTNDPAQLTPWLMYWVSFACITLFETYTYWLFSFIPFYGLIRLILLSYLVLPQTQGAKVAYQKYIHPFLQQHESEIEEYIAKAHAKAREFGLEYIENAIYYIKEHVLGVKTVSATPQNMYVPATNSYVAGLLSRFSIPSARDGLSVFTGQAAAGGMQAGADLTSLLGTAMGMLNRTPASQISSSSSAFLPIPTHLATHEQLSLINSQREKLTSLLRALDVQAASLGTGSVPVPGGMETGHELTKTKSEVSFTNVEREDVDDLSGSHTPTQSSRPKARTSGSWFWGSSGRAKNE